MATKKEQWVEAITAALLSWHISKAAMYEKASDRAKGNEERFDLSQRTIQRVLNGSPDASELSLLKLIDDIPRVFPATQIASELKTSLKELYAALKGELPGLLLQCIGTTAAKTRCNFTRDVLSTDRFCPDCTIGAMWPTDEQEKYATCLPGWDKELDLTALPPLVNPSSDLGPPDLFACLSKPELSQSSSQAWTSTKLNPYLPYQHDFLRSHGWRCGSPRVFSSERIKAKTGLLNAQVLDLGWYQWSRSLKDLRSWAIVNTALEADPPKTHLAVWTAGNAGLSLAMLAHAANLYLPPEKRLHVYALFNSDLYSPEPAQPEGPGFGFALRVLKHWQCKTDAVSNPHNQVLPPGEIKEKVMDQAEGRCTEENYWEVSDGWDVVGMVMYRLLFAQVICALQPEFLVVPVGTGNLLLGALQAVRDCKSRTSTQVIAAVPDGDSVFDLIERVKVEHEVPSKAPSHAATKSTPPSLPKLSGAYSPLLPCLDAERKHIRIMRVDQGMLLQTAEDLMGKSSERLAIIAEPNALAAFAVLPRLRKDHQNAKIVVVNSGYGLMRDDERAFWELAPV